MPAALATTDLILNGVFERHPELRLGIVELSAVWVPLYLMMLDGGSQFVARLSGRDSALRLRPSDYFRRQVRVSCFAYELPTRIAKQLGGAELLMACSDYPHSEGTAHPLADYAAGRFGTSPRAVAGPVRAERGVPAEERLRALAPALLSIALTLGASDEHAGHAGSDAGAALRAARARQLRAAADRSRRRRAAARRGRARPRRCSRSRPGEAALVSFVYLSCPDACPTATATFAALDAKLAERPALARRVAARDGELRSGARHARAMAALRGALAPRGRWRFATAASAAAIEPVLADFGQDAAPIDDTGLVRHVLKVFLVDGEGRIRNVYSAGFLDVRLLLADLETVLGG